MVYSVMIGSVSVKNCELKIIFVQKVVMKLRNPRMQVMLRMIDVSEIICIKVLKITINCLYTQKNHLRFWQKYNIIAD